MGLVGNVSDFLDAAWDVTDPSSQDMGAVGEGRHS